MTIIHLDFETYSEMPFGKGANNVGLDNYAKHPSTEVLMTAWAVDQGPVQWMEDWSNLGISRSYVEDPTVEWHAFNAQFERTILREVLNIDIPIERWRCTMVHAYHLSFSGGLAQVGQQMGLPQDKQKLHEGGRLIQKFCKPAPKNHKVKRYTKENSPEDWAKFREYNIQDVVAERELGMLMARYPMPESEWDLYFMDQRVNDRGLPVDREIVEAGVEIYHDEKRHLTAELKRLTALGNPNSGPQMLAWLTRWGYPFDNLKAETVDKALDPLMTWTFEELPLEVLRLKQQLARTAGSKWEAFQRMTDWDTNRLRYAFQFAGASRTSRWGGRGVQPHNLHRSPEDQDEKVRSMLV